MTQQRPPNQGPPNQQQAAQARAKIEQMKRQFEQKRAIADSLGGIGTQIGVYSGKGGVGKTTVAANLAVTLAQDGAAVGILDVDIDCPNVVRAMKVAEVPVVSEENKLVPPERFGVRVMSMAYFQKNEEEATIWRGPMIHNAINQLLQSTAWGEARLPGHRPTAGHVRLAPHCDADPEPRRLRGGHDAPGAREDRRQALHQHD